jgi:hypothetical protein
LSAIGHWVVFRLTRWSWQIRTGFLGPRATRDTSTERRNALRLRDLHPLWSGLQTCSPIRPHLAPAVRQNRHVKSHNPDHATPAGYHTWTGLAPSAFARHYSRNHCCFLFLRVLRCFTSPRSLQTAYVFSCRSCGMMPHGVSPFGNPGLNVRLSTPPGLSQIPTSFIGSQCQGIHRAPLKT